MCLSSVKIVSILHHRMIPGESCNKPEVVDLLSWSGSYLVVRVSFKIVSDWFVLWVFQQAEIWL